MSMDEFGFMDLLVGYQPSMTIIAARRVGLYDALTATPQTVSRLAAELNADEGTLGALLRALAGIGLIDEHDGGYVTTDFVTEHLTGDRDFALVIDKEEYFANAWLSLDDVVRTGKPVLEPWQHRLETDPETATMFLEALNVLAETGPPVWQLPEFASADRILDVGGGFGYYAEQIAATGATVVLVDLPPVIAQLEHRLGPAVGGSIELVAADVMATSSCGVDPASVDAALVSHMIHDRNEADGIDLLRRVARAIKPGGAVVVNDFAGDFGPGAFGPLFDVMMRVETGGAAHSLETLRSMLGSAGFDDIRVADFPQPITVLTGRVA